MRFPTARHCGGEEHGTRIRPRRSDGQWGDGRRELHEQVRGHGVQVHVERAGEGAQAGERHVPAAGRIPLVFADPARAHARHAGQAGERQPAHGAHGRHPLQPVPEEREKIRVQPYADRIPVRHDGGRDPAGLRLRGRRGDAGPFGRDQPPIPGDDERAPQAASRGRIGDDQTCLRGFDGQPPLRDRIGGDGEHGVRFGHFRFPFGLFPLL